MPPKGAGGGGGFCDCARRGARATLADRRPETRKLRLYINIFEFNLHSTQYFC